MIADNWPQSWQSVDLNQHYRTGFISGRKAVARVVDHVNRGGVAWSLSDGDLAWWCYNDLRETVDIEWFDALSRTSGLHEEDREPLFGLFEIACLNADDWLLQYHWPEAERFTYAALLSIGCIFEEGWVLYNQKHKRKVECNAVYKLHDFGMWWWLLRHHRLAVVSNIADDVCKRLTHRPFVAHNKGNVTWRIGVSCQFPSLDVPKSAPVEEVLGKLGTYDWDLLLCSAGSASAIFCEYARSIGKAALDIGAFDKVLLGHEHNQCESFVAVE